MGFVIRYYDEFVSYVDWRDLSGQSQLHTCCNGSVRRCDLLAYGSPNIFRLVDTFYTNGIDTDGDDSSVHEPRLAAYHSKLLEHLRVGCCVLMTNVDSISTVE